MDKKKEGRKYLKISCDKCNKIMFIRSDYAKKHSGYCQSCGKVGNKNAATHGLSKTRLYRIWTGLSHRRYNYGNPEICEEWRNFDNFKKWSIANGYNENLCIDRINTNSGYNPNNCQWITVSENSRKDRIIFNESESNVIFNEWINTNITQREQANKYNCSRNTIQRIHKKHKILNNIKKYGATKKIIKRTGKTSRSQKSG